MRDSSMRVLLVSENLALPPDEGLKKFVYSIGDRLSELVDVKLISTRPSGPVGESITVAPANLFMGGRQLRGLIREFEPSHIVYVPRSGGTRNAFIRLWRLRSYYPRARTAMVVLQSRRYGWLGGKVASYLRPDVVLAQGPTVRKALAGIGIDAADIPSGVDTRQFSPVSPARKAEIREQFRIARGSKVVLHVGHLKRSRNVLLLKRIHEKLGCECVVVGSTSTTHQQDVKVDLQQAGVHVIDEFVENIADIYRMADCYVFPVHSVGDAIEMPLSVLEALACGVPVVSTRFGSLDDWLPASAAMIYGDTDEELTSEVVACLSRAEDAMLVDAAGGFSWGAVASRLVASLDERVEGAVPGSAGDAWPNAAGT